MSNSTKERIDISSPPPPPLPPEVPGSKISSHVLKLKTISPDFYFQAKNPPQCVEESKSPRGPYFFYGTLMDPFMIREVLELDIEPELRPAPLSGYECKLWGQYPALLDAADCVVEGVVYHVTTVEHGRRLANYETHNYYVGPCLTVPVIPFLGSIPVQL
ncbi:hypothetical protein N7523_007197 [Penicillium sp. IBT 18751x]|nr:hypothetical protein N7523_007197 [Penicillium sp. IBT 18751x]